MNPVEEIKNRLSIIDVISSYIEVNKTGASYKAKCPFHNEKTPSFFISPDRGGYYCFGCGAKGDIFTFVEQFEGLDFKGALKVLADKAGVPLVWNREEKKNKEEKEILYEIMEEATKFFEKNLNPNSVGYKYLIGRGLKPETIKNFRLGLALDGWNELENYLKNKAYSVKHIELAGLIKKNDKGGFYDRFRNRVIFPISDTSGRVIAFTGRILGSDDKIAKYLNSPETPLFTKANVFYGLDKAKTSIREKNYSILVEGQMDLIMSHQAGITNVIAGSGTALTDNLSINAGNANAENKDGLKNEVQNNAVTALGLIKRLSPNMMMVYDADGAGERAAVRSALIALEIGMDVKIASIPEGKDPADAILKDPEIFRDALKKSKHVVEFVLDLIMRDITDSRKLARAVAEKVLPIVARVERYSEQSQLIKIINSKSGISEAALLEDLKIEMKKREDSKKQTVSSSNVYKNPRNVSSTLGNGKSGAGFLNRRDTTLRKLVGLIEWKKNDTTFDSNSYKADLERIIGKKYSEILELILKENSDPAFEAEQFYSGVVKLAEVVKETIYILESEALKEEFTKKMQEISLAERNKDEKKAVELLKECQELSKRISNLKLAN